MLAPSQQAEFSLPEKFEVVLHISPKHNVLDGDRDGAELLQE